MVSNYKMDFIDPDRKGSGMISSRNTGRKNDLCQRFVELPPNSSRTLNYDRDGQLLRDPSKRLNPNKTARATLKKQDPSKSRHILGGFVLVDD